MKIKTITCHDVYNYGASLQAYALQYYLISQGHEVEIIDYKPPYLSGHYQLWSIANPRWEANFLTKGLYLVLKLPRRLISLRRKKIFDCFRASYLCLTSKRYSSNEELSRNVPFADVYIAGSDQIWNTVFQNGRDAAFYLDFAPKSSRRIAYAASFATESIVPEYVEFVQQQLQNFQRISVRESGALTLLQTLGVSDATWVCDPVFLLDRRQWDELATKRYTEKYLLIYDFEQNEMIHQIAMQIATQRGLKIYSINVKLSYAHRSYLYVGPIEFVSLIRNADYVISNSFHGTAFSLIYNKEFCVIPRKEGINTRMQNLLAYLGISERFVSRIEGVRDIPKINYSEINQLMDRYIMDSKSFLKDVLE